MVLVGVTAHAVELTQIALPITTTDTGRYRPVEDPDCGHAAASSAPVDAGSPNHEPVSAWRSLCELVILTAGRPGKANQGRTTTHPSGNYVQVRYPQDRRWVTVAVSETRRIAAAIAADAYRNLPNDDRQTPTQVRVISASQLHLEGGHHATQAAHTDVARGAQTSGC